MPVIEARGIVKHFGGVSALDGVDLLLEPGEVHALCGENGAGKSTLNRILSGAIQPDSGSILLDGATVDFANVSDAEAAGIAIVHQESAVFQSLDAADNLGLLHEPTQLGGLWLNRHAQLEDARARLAALGESFDVTTPLEALSPAQRQMVAIARAVGRGVPPPRSAGVPPASLPTNSPSEISTQDVTSGGQGPGGGFSLPTNPPSEISTQEKSLLDVPPPPASDPQSKAELSDGGQRDAGGPNDTLRLLILDEPTSSLSKTETEALFRVVRGLRRQGVAILYVSHRLDEIFELADRVSILRDGRNVWTKPVPGLTREDLIRAMVGREVVETQTRTPAVPTTSPPRIEVKGFTREDEFYDISFDVKPGEVVGIGGLIGAGRSELARAIFGLTTPDSGSVVLLPDSRLALVPEDRQHEGLHLDLPIRENLSMASLPRLARGGLLERQRETELSHRLIGDLGIKTENDGDPANSLSGGNQQKVLLGKWFATGPNVLLLDEPTRGVDVGAKAEVHRLIREHAANGVAVILVSSELPELLSLSDRILVMRQGRISGELSGAEATQDKVLELALPVEDKVAATTKGHRQLRPEWQVGALLALILVGVGLANPAFLAADNLRDLLVKIAPTVIVGCGLTLVILAREIDISVGSSMGLAAATLGLLCSADRLGLPVWVGVVGCLAIAGIVGMVNGLLVSKLKIPSIIVTLGMLTLLQGITEVLMAGKWIEKMPSALRHLGAGSSFGVPNPILAAVAVVLLFLWVTVRSPFGRRVYALGSNPDAAIAIGLPVGRLRVAVFALTGVLVGVAALFSATQLQVIESGFGRGFELAVVAAVVVGGTSIRGGRGSITGTVVGAALLGVMGTALIFLRLGESSVYWERAIQGSVILLAVVADSMRRRRR